MLAARVVVEQSSLLNETHLLTPKSLVYSSRLVKKKIVVANIHSGSSWGRGKLLGPFRGRESKKVGNRCLFFLLFFSYPIGEEQTTGTRGRGWYFDRFISHTSHVLSQPRSNYTTQLGGSLSSVD